MPKELSNRSFKETIVKTAKTYLTPKTKFKFSIVSAVYNVEKYIDHFMESIVAQTLDFRSNIQVVLVDDGSTDSTPSKLAYWASKYPNNIIHITKANGGQASARNAGLGLAKGEWISFADPDDFLDKNYFLEISVYANGQLNNSDCVLISCNTIFYREQYKVYDDTHPLRSRFSKGNRHFSIEGIGKTLILSAASSLYRSDHISKFDLIFDERIRPAFEDAHFTNIYLLSCEDSECIALLNSAKYYYRKRMDKSSTLDTANKHSGYFDAQLSYGYLGLIRKSILIKGYIPVYIQRLVLYDLVWKLELFLDNQYLYNELSPEQSRKFSSLFKECMSHIHENTIHQFEFGGLWRYHKVGILAQFKNSESSFDRYYITSFDISKKALKIQYHSTRACRVEQILVDGIECQPVIEKTIEHTLFGEVFVYERLLWVEFGNGSELCFSADGRRSEFSIGGHIVKSALPLDGLSSEFNLPSSPNVAVPREARVLREAAMSDPVIKIFENCWLFIDRDTGADDNAEHLYRHVTSAYPDVNSWFVLRRNSPDWERLAQEGFRLIDFGSRRHKLALLNADFLISSHADAYLFDVLDKRFLSDIIKYRYVFLQHGVTKDDLSDWLNRKPIDLFVTSSQAEYDSIVGDGRYKFTAREVALCGFPRHDRLVRQSARPPESKIVLIMPTWRDNLVGPVAGSGNKRTRNDEFEASNYAQLWGGLLNSERLRSILETYGYRARFVPHENMRPYFDSEPSSIVEIISNNPSTSLQEEFLNASILMTDYSSVAFDMAVINTMTLYFQFDYDTIFGGNHIYKKGYFDYATDGFGPVETTIDGVLDNLEKALSRDCAPEEPYSTRMRDCIAYRDEGNCERVTQRILALRKPEYETADVAHSLRSAVQRSVYFGDWEKALMLWSRLADITGNADWVPVAGASKAALNLGQLELAESFIARSRECECPEEEITLLLGEAALCKDDLDSAKDQFKRVLGMKAGASADFYARLGLCRARSAGGDLTLAAQDLPPVEEPAFCSETLEIYTKFAERMESEGKFSEAADCWERAMGAAKRDDLYYRYFAAFTKALIRAGRFEPVERLLIAANGSSLTRKNDITLLNAIYASERRDWPKANFWWSELVKYTPKNRSFQTGYWLELAKAQFECEEWKNALNSVEQFASRSGRKSRHTSDSLALRDEIISGQSQN